MNLLNFFKKQKGKKIIVERENQGNFPMSFNNKTWEFLIKIHKGRFTETSTNYQILIDGKELIFDKDSELKGSLLYNKYLKVDIINFDVMELTNDIGSFLLYRGKNEDKRNIFIITSLGGLMGGSSISFKLKN